MERVEDLVVRARLGDTAAYQALVQRFERMALAYAYSILGDYELAEDARQEAFIGAYCDLVSLREPAAFPGWLRALVRNHSVRIIRGRHVLMVPLEELDLHPADTPDPGERIDEERRRERIARAVERLPAREREVTRLYYFEELSLREIGRRLNLEPKTVKSRLHTARERLRQRLMDMVKQNVTHSARSGNTAPAEAATAEAVVRFDERLAALLKPPGREELREAGELICAKGRLLRFLGRMAEAHASFEQGLNLPALKNEPLLRARLLAEVGLTHLQTSDYGRAREFLRRARAGVARREPRSVLMAAILNYEGMSAWGGGDFAGARTHYEQSFELSRENGSTHFEAETLNNLGLLEWKAGRLDEATRRFKESLPRWRKLKNRFGVAATLMNLGIIEEQRGHAAAARRRYREALALAEELDYVQLQSPAYCNLASLELDAEAWDRAAEAADRAIELAQTCGDRRSEAIALENKALALLGLGRGQEALATVDDAERLARAIGDRERLFSLRLVRVEVALKTGTEIPREDFKDLEREMKSLGLEAEAPRLGRLRALSEWKRGHRDAAAASAARAREEAERLGLRGEARRIRQIMQQIGKPNVRNTGRTREESSS